MDYSSLVHLMYLLMRNKVF